MLHSSRDHGRLRDSYGDTAVQREDASHGGSVRGSRAQDGGRVPGGLRGAGRRKAPPGSGSLEQLLRASFGPRDPRNDSRHHPIPIYHPKGKAEGSNSNTHRFLAAPKPPGKMAASWLAALSWARSLILPRAILADSVRTFLGKSTEHRTRASVRDGRSSRVEPRRLSWPHGEVLTRDLQVNTRKRQEMRGRKAMC